MCSRLAGGASNLFSTPAMGGISSALTKLVTRTMKLAPEDITIPEGSLSISEIEGERNAFEEAPVRFL